MVDAILYSGNRYRAVSSASDMRAPVPSVESRPAAAALSPPAAESAAPSDAAQDIGDLSFLYAPSGRPGVAALPSQAMPTGERAAPARLAIESGALNALMSSFLTARTAAPQAGAEPAQSVIAKIYEQF